MRWPALRPLLLLDRPLAVVLVDDVHDAVLVLQHLRHRGLRLFQLVNHQLTALNVTLQEPKPLVNMSCTTQ